LKKIKLLIIIINEKMSELKYKKLIPEAQTPTKSYESDAGWDFYSTSIEVTPNYIQYHTGIALEIPENMVGLAFPRSSITNKDLMLKNSVGVIDAGYRNEIVFRFINTNKSKNIYEIGDRIGQLIFIPIPQITLVETDNLSISPRNMGGFGHSGS
jgi:dUTP pyrophosphatase